MFAIGDAAWYPGKLRLILSGFHEAALMAQAVRRLLLPTERPILHYTTTSTSLKARLGAGD
jgi:thioredoxin reductase (NADPH)